MQLPVAVAVPWPEQVVASLVWQVAPAKPTSQEHVPFAKAVPWPEQVPLREYWHWEPA
jgi:hypothetical protein